jgi:hypothetical protein
MEKVTEIADYEWVPSTEYWTGPGLIIAVLCQLRRLFGICV